MPDKENMCKCVDEGNVFCLFILTWANHNSSFPQAPHFDLHSVVDTK